MSGAMRGDAIYPQQRATSTTTAQGNRDCHNPGSATLEAAHTAGLHYPESDARFGHFSRYNPGSNLKIRGLNSALRTENTDKAGGGTTPEPNGHTDSYRPPRE